jgi:hypothetical protein
VYVDDLIILGKSTEVVNVFKQEMKKVFHMSDLGVLSYYMGIELCQSAYAGKLLEKVGISNCNPCAVPMEPKLILSKEGNSSPIDQTEYRSLIGSLRYLLRTQPELTFSVSYLSRFMEKPCVEHMAAVKHLLCYVAGTLNYGMFYPRGEGGSLAILGYSDSDMGGDVDDSKSTSHMIFFLGGNPLTWNSQKQRVVTLSSCEAEYIAGTGAACRAIWVSHLVEEMMGMKLATPIIKMDNKSGISLSKNPVLHDWSKHIKIRYNFICECVEHGEIHLEFVGTQDQLADILTKPLAKVRFHDLRKRIGVIKLSSVKNQN